MRASISACRPLSCLKLAAVSALALTAAACSSADRFASNPFENPFGSGSGSSQVYSTGSVNQPMPAGQPITPSGSVTSQPLPPPGGSSYVPQSTAVPYAAASGPMTTGTVTPRPMAASGRAGWGTQGGSTVVVRQGDTTAALAQRYGVPQNELLKANNIPAGTQLLPGQRVTIPVYRSAGVPAASGQTAAPAVQNRSPAMAASPVPQRPATPQSKGGGGSHMVESGETLYSVARRYQVSPGALASANGVSMDHRVRIGERLVLPGGAGSAPAVAQAGRSVPQQTASIATPKPVAAPAPAPAASQPEAQITKVVASPRTAPAQAAAARAEETDDSGSATSSEASFRWPVRGRVISGFGSKPDGSSNEGINLSVPAGTSVRAAEGGVVAYAGNELKGYGNLVLVRHSGGWVTAYAHASEIMVKRGDVVRRGQIIAKSGQSGNVNAPQLHFEVRRGATPVDPMQHLPAS